MVNHLRRWSGIKSALNRHLVRLRITQEIVGLSRRKCHGEHLKNLRYFKKVRRYAQYPPPPPPSQQETSNPRWFNPLTAKLFNLNLHPLEIVSR